MKERWKPIPGYLNYEVSNYGQVRSVARTDAKGHKRKGKILKQYPDGYGYMQVTLYNYGKGRSAKVHQIVMKTFVGQCPKGYQVNHIDENKANNRINNLEFVTPKQNSNHGTRNERLSKAFSKPVKCIETGEIYYGIHEASKQTNISYQNIWKVCKGERKTAGGYHWEYERM